MRRSISLPAVSRLGVMASISSMKRRHGARPCASANKARTFASDSPDMPDTISGAAIFTNDTPSSPATAFATNVCSTTVNGLEPGRVMAYLAAAGWSMQQEAPGRRNAKVLVDLRVGERRLNELSDLLQNVLETADVTVASCRTLTVGDRVPKTLLVRRGFSLLRLLLLRLVLLDLVYRTQRRVDGVGILVRDQVNGGVHRH